MTSQPHYSEIDQSGLTDAHMLDLGRCIIEWARYESNLRALLTALERRPLDFGARDYSRLSPEDVWKRIIKLLRAQGASTAVLDLAQSHRASSRISYDARKTIAHAGCVGVWKIDPKFIVFAPFESQNLGEIVLIWMPTVEIHRSTSFARAATDMVNRLMKQLGY